MNPQNATANLQGGNISVQGSNYNPQPASTIPIQSGNTSTIQGARNTIAAGQNASAGVNGLLSTGNSELASSEQLIQQLEQQMANKPVAPTLNLTSIQASAQQAAQNTVNPLYTQQLNQYLQNEAAATQEQTQQNQINIQGYQSTLGNTLAQNQQTQNAAAQTNALTQGDINAQATNYQLNSGNAQTQKVAALQSSIGQGGLTGSGLGSQQLYQAENLRNVEDAQQQGGFQYNRDVANLTATNTFAQLAQSSQFAQTQEGQQEAQSNFNLNSYLRQSQYESQQYQEALSAWQQQAITAAAQNNEASAVSNALGAYRGNAGVYSAGVQAYAPQLNTVAAPSLINPLSYQG